MKQWATVEWRFAGKDVADDCVEEGCVSKVQQRFAREKGCSRKL